MLFSIPIKTWPLKVADFPPVLYVCDSDPILQILHIFTLLWISRVALPGPLIFFFLSHEVVTSTNLVQIKSFVNVFKLYTSSQKTRQHTYSVLIQGLRSLLLSIMINLHLFATVYSSLTVSDFLCAVILERCSVKFDLNSTLIISHWETQGAGLPRGLCCSCCWYSTCCHCKRSWGLAGGQ